MKKQGTPSIAAVLINEILPTIFSETIFYEIYDMVFPTLLVDWHAGRTNAHFPAQPKIILRISGVAFGGVDDFGIICGRRRVAIFKRFSSTHSDDEVHLLWPIRTFSFGFC